MKFIHLSDLHIGKRVNEFSMIEDQKYILTKIINIIDEEQPDGIFIAGDVYDKSMPSDEAVHVLNDFLTRIAKRKIETFIISGNHDSAVKLSFASDLIDLSGIHIAKAYDGQVKALEMKKGEETVMIYMLPFVKPVNVRSIFKDLAEDIHDYSDACRVAIDHMEVDEKNCNILLAHQFVTGAEPSESEELSVGGMEDVSASVFDAFDYVALGHIHGPQRVGRDTVRYSGTPLKYSFSEANHKKSVTIVETKGKEITLRTKELIPLHDMREIKGSFDEITNKKNYEGTALDDYMSLVLTDEEDILDAMGKLRVIYPNLMKLRYDNRRTRENQVIEGASDVEHKQPIELFGEFYELMNNQELSEEQYAFSLELMERIWG